MIGLKEPTFDEGFLYALRITQTEPLPALRTPALPPPRSLEGLSEDELLHELENDLTRAANDMDRWKRCARRQYEHGRYWKRKAIFRQDVLVISCAFFGLVCFLVWVTPQ